MKRREKIKALRAISEGKLTIEDFGPSQVYFFLQKSTQPAIYEYNGKEYNETEYREFCEKIKSKNNNSIIWNESKEYAEQDKIITLVFPEGE